MNRRQFLAAAVVAPVTPVPKMSKLVRFTEALAAGPLVSSDFVFREADYFPPDVVAQFYSQPSYWVKIVW